MQSRSAGLTGLCLSSSTEPLELLCTPRRLEVCGLPAAWCDALLRVLPDMAVKQRGADENRRILKPWMGTAIGSPLGTEEDVSIKRLSVVSDCLPAVITDDDKRVAAEISVCST